MNHLWISTSVGKIPKVLVKSENGFAEITFWIWWIEHTYIKRPRHYYSWNELLFLTRTFKTTIKPSQMFFFIKITSFMLQKNFTGLTKFRRRIKEHSAGWVRQRMKSWKNKETVGGFVSHASPSRRCLYKTNEIILKELSEAVIEKKEATGGGKHRKNTAPFFCHAILLQGIVSVIQIECYSWGEHSAISGYFLLLFWSMKGAAAKKGC